MIKEQNQQDEEMNEFKEEIINVNCSYCGKEIECPKDMMDKVEKHACLDCFENLPKDKNNQTKIHVDIPISMDKALEDIANKFAGKQTREFFPEIWADHKDEMKEMSKKE